MSEHGRMLSETGAPPPFTTLPERNLDVLRATAVLAVLVCHFFLTWYKRPLLHVLGSIGVYTFFVHTSLVLMSSSERLIAKADGDGWIQLFYVRRLLRIYPLAIVTVLLVVVAGLPFDTELGSLGIEVSRLGVIANLLLVQNLFGVDNVLIVLWTLPLEIQMYAALPLCFLLQRKGLTWLLGALALAFVGGAIYLNRGEAPGLWRLSILAYTPCFMAGVVSFYLLRTRTRKAPLPSWAWPVAIAGWTLLWWALYGFNHHGVDAAWIFSLGLGLLIPFFRDSVPSAARGWSSIPAQSVRAMHAVAHYSYSIYLIHMIVIAVIWRGHEQTGMIMLVALAAIALFRARRIDATSIVPGLLAVALWRRTPTVEFDVFGTALFIAIGTVLVVGAYVFIEGPAIEFGKRLKGPAAPDLIHGVVPDRS